MMLKAFLAIAKSKKYVIPEGDKIIIASSLDKAKEILKEKVKKDLAKYSWRIRRRVSWALKELSLKEGILYEEPLYLESGCWP